MARKYLFLVHGVGKQPAGTWSDGWRTQILTSLKNYAPFKGMSDEDIEKDHVKFVPISYDAVFDGFRERWSNLAGALGHQEVTSNRALQKAVEWVETSNDPDDTIKRVFWDVVMDAVLWFTMPLARGAVIATVARQFAEGVRDMYAETGGENTAHILAHSLGTSVTHDALISLRFSNDLHGGVFDPAQHRWRSLFMVANTSRLLHSKFDMSEQVGSEEYAPYKSKIMPGSGAAICSKYFNIRQRVDPITWPLQFNPAGWPSSYTNIETVRFGDLKDIHSCTHYIANPHFHINLFRTLMSNNRLATADEVRDTMKNFERDFPMHAGLEFSALRDSIGGNLDKKLNAKEIAAYLIRAYKEMT